MTTTSYDRMAPPDGLIRLLRTCMEGGYAFRGEVVPLTLEGAATLATWSPDALAHLPNVWATLPSMKPAFNDTFLEVQTAEGIGMELTLRIKGASAVQAYCDRQTWADADAVWEERVVVERQDDASLGPGQWQWTAAQHAQTVVDAASMTAWKEHPKYHRLVRHVRYESKKAVGKAAATAPSMGRLAYEVQWVKAATEASVGLNTSDAQQQVATGHVTLVWEPDAPDAKVEPTAAEVKTVAQSVWKHWQHLLQWTFQEPILMTHADRQAVLRAYEGQLQHVFPKARNGRANETVFFAPKPLTLEQRHLEPPGRNYGTWTVLQDYAITEKADGERMLLFVHTDGCIYTIDNTLRVKATGVSLEGAGSHEWTGTLLDGEFVPASHWRGGQTSHATEPMTKSHATDVFMAFDVYFHGKTAVWNRPLFWKTATEARGQPSRMDVMRAFIEALPTQDASGAPASLTILLKEHRVSASPTEFYATCREMLNGAEKLPFDMDGLIFTPAYMPVFGHYPNTPVTVPFNVRWDRVFKWKPPQENTIDFLVKERGFTRHPVTRHVYRVYELYTGYNPQQWEPIEVDQGLAFTYAHRESRALQNERSTYYAKKFEPMAHGHPDVALCYVPLDGPGGAGGVAFTAEGDRMEHESVVEFAYDTSPEAVPDGVADAPAWRWRPKRLRVDKTRLLRLKGNMSRTANDLTVAVNIWDSIHHPVTVGLITGQEHAPEHAVPTDLEERMLGTNDVYYARDMHRNQMLSVHMLNFHNHGIKQALYKRIPRKDALLELACGMAGDLPRWQSSGFKFVLGMDLVRDNITKPKEGAYARLVAQRSEHYRQRRDVHGATYPTVVFVIGDCAKPIETGECSRKLDATSQKVLDMLYRGNVPNDWGFLQKWRIPGRAANGFTGASCQFAIHYFFKNPHMLRSFLKNVANNLRKGGVFVATFMDGLKVHENLAAHAESAIRAPNEAVTWKGVKKDTTVWAITQRYDAFTPDDAFGKVIEVYLENTRREIPEFLVHREVLEREAANVGLTWTEDGMFGDTFEQLYDAIPANVTRDWDARAARGQSLDAYVPKANRLHYDLWHLKHDDVQRTFSFLNRWVVFTKSV